MDPSPKVSFVPARDRQLESETKGCGSDDSDGSQQSEGEAGELGEEGGCDDSGGCGDEWSDSPGGPEWETEELTGDYNETTPAEREAGKTDLHFWPTKKYWELVPTKCLSEACKGLDTIVMNPWCKPHPLQPRLCH